MLNRKSYNPYDWSANSFVRKNAALGIDHVFDNLSAEVILG